MARNPKDVMVSSFFFHQMAKFLDESGSFEEFLEKFLTGKGELMVSQQKQSSVLNYTLNLMIALFMDM